MMKESESQAQPTGNGSLLRKAVYLFLIIFFVLGSLAAYTVVTSVNRAQEAVAPVGDLVRQLAIPATPVILPDPSTIVNQVQDKTELVTVHMELEKIVRAERNQEVLWGALGESLIFVAYGRVEAGVDLSQLSEDDIVVVDPDTVMVHLPEAQIFADKPILDTEKSYVADRDTGLLTRSDPELETEVRRAAEAEILAAAQESDLTQRAEQNAQEFMRIFLQGVGFNEVVFTDGPPPTVVPFEQELPKGYVLTPAPTPAE